MKIIAITARIVLGAMFIFSGFVKAIDPWGSTYKFIDYFTAFNMTWMQPAAFMLAIVQNSAEFVIGVALVLGLRMRETAWGALLFMGFFTPLTLFIALTNPVSDCGCFGDALKLTNWETFFKNIAFLVPTFIVFYYRNKFVPAYRPLGEWSWVALITIVILGISIHCHRHLPWIDFRPYRIGADIPQAMSIPEGAPTAEFHTTLIYEKDGVEQEFSINDFPWNDSTWVFVDAISVEVSRGYVPPITNFSIMTEHGADITYNVLEYDGYTFLLVAHRLNGSNRQALEKASEIADFCNAHGHRFYCLTATPRSEVELVKSELGLRYDFGFTDETTLKTVIRANPGLVLLQNGVVLGKWHYNDMPDAADLKPNLLSFAMEHQAKKSKDLLIRGLLLAFVFFTFVFFQFRK